MAMEIAPFEDAFPTIKVKGFKISASPVSYTCGHKS